MMRKVYCVGGTDWQVRCSADCARYYIDRRGYGRGRAHFGTYERMMIGGTTNEARIQAGAAGAMRTFLGGRLPRGYTGSRLYNSLLAWFRETSEARDRIAEADAIAVRESAHGAVIVRHLSSRPIGAHIQEITLNGKRHRLVVREDGTMDLLTWERSERRNLAYRWAHQYRYRRGDRDVAHGVAELLLFVDGHEYATVPQDEFEHLRSRVLEVINRIWVKREPDPWLELTRGNSRYRIEPSGGSSEGFHSCRILMDNIDGLGFARYERGQPGMCALAITGAVIGTGSIEATLTHLSHNPPQVRTFRRIYQYVRDCYPDRRNPNDMRRIRACLTPGQTFSQRLRNALERVTSRRPLRSATPTD